MIHYLSSHTWKWDFSQGLLSEIFTKHQTEEKKGVSLCRGLLLQNLAWRNTKWFCLPPPGMPNLLPLLLLPFSPQKETRERKNLKPSFQYLLASDILALYKLSSCQQPSSKPSHRHHSRVHTACQLWHNAIQSQMLITSFILCCISDSSASQETLWASVLPIVCGASFCHPGKLWGKTQQRFWKKKTTIWDQKRWDLLWSGCEALAYSLTHQ